ncbi:MAG: amino acid adenylation domain-containing protein [Nostoc sp.]|uniref:amino acid adenylation domain-containing protein n=1 Tax=Nostoc sp. TaxID=1180 RepID=UPI002FFD0974
MNNIYSFLSHLRSLDVKLFLDGERLRCKAPKGILTPQLQAQIAERKPEILAFLHKDVVYAIEPVSRTGNLPLSFAQARLWFLDKLQPNSGFYNIPIVWRFSGQLNVAALQSSLNEIIRRHEALRTNFVTQEEQPVQVIAATVSLPLEIVDLLHLPQGEREVEMQRLVTNKAGQPFNLERETLIRPTLFQLGSREYVFLLTAHHIIFDGWSTGVFVQELATLYNAFWTDKPTVLPELPIQYADFAVWQRRWLEKEVLAEQLSYWKQQLEGAPTLLELPTDRPRPAIQTNRGGHQQFTLSLELGEALANLSKRAAVTPFMAYFAAFVTLLYRYTGEKDILVGTPIAGRNRPEIEGIIGLFVNTLVLRTDLSGDPSFEQLLIRVREVALQAYAHQDLPFEKLVDALQPERSLSHLPLFQVMFDLQNVPIPSLDLPEITVSSFPIETGTAKFDLALSINCSSGLIAEWEYNSDLFDDSTIARMAGNFQTLLAGIVANPQQSISQLPLLTEVAAHQLLVEWNDTQVDYPCDKCIHQLFEEQVERNPEAVAVVFENQQMTYGELNYRANQLAHYLQSLGVGADVLVGLCVERSVEMVVGLLAILKAGGAYLPIDPEYPQERLSFMLADTQVKVLLTQEKLVESLPQHQARIVCLDTNWQSKTLTNQDNLNSTVSSENLSYVIYTSGSTGTPKGVAVTHQAVNRLILNTNYIQLTPDDHVAQAANIAFDAATFEIWGALLHGAKLVIITKSALLIPKEFAANIGYYKISVLFLTTALFNQLASFVPQAFSSLRYLLFGGEAVDPKWVQEILDKGAPQHLLHVYGPTENTTFSSWYLVEDLPNTATTIPIGRAISNTQIYLLDQNLQLVPIGVPGELYLGGAGLARGYLNRPELTEEKFIPNPYSNKPGDRLYKTGDKVRYLSDGNIQFLGRIDNQVKIRGFRIELGEVEAAIAQHPTVQETVVVAREDIPGRKYLAAYIVPNQSNAPTTSELRGFLKEKLPDYMIPGAFVMLDALPLTPNGKVDRRALPVPQTAHEELAASLVAPRTELEEILAQIWCEVFHLQQISIHDNFFELGGDSILSILIISKANQAGLQLTPKQIFERQTIAELAVVASTAQTRKAEQGLVSGTLPLTPIQHWFFAQNLPEPNHFNQAFLLEAPQAIDPILLQQVVQQLLVHHDALRLRFVQSGSNWQQFNDLSNDTIAFSSYDLSAIPDAEQKAALETTAATLQASLNLSSGSLVQVAFFALGTDKPSRLLIVIHHLAVDGVSWRILLEDLKTGYQQLSKGERIQLPPKTTSFKYWAIRLTQYARSGALESELAYWLTLSRQHVNRIPMDYPSRDNTVASARTVSVSLSPEETRALLQEVPSAYKTQINDVLLTALVQVLGNWTGNNSLLLNLEGHGREDIFEDVDLSRTVGWFTTIFPVLLQMEATDNLGDSLSSIKEQLRAIPNQGIGYGLLRYLSGDAEITSVLQALPTAEVSFNYLGQFDWGMEETSLFKIAKESIGSEHSQIGHRSHLLDINGIVVEGQLQLDWIYSENVHHRETISHLAHKYIQALQALIVHCQLPEAILPDDTELTYPLAKMQEFMLHHYANDPQKMGVYHCQLSYDIYDESLCLSAFKKALKISVQKHPALRTVFIIQNGKPAVQVVKNNLRFSINEQDISHIKSDEQENYIDEVVKQDRQNLFNVENSNEPLFRFWIFRKAKNKFEFFMSIHHAIIDGWGNIEFLNQLYEFYSALKKGEEITVAKSANVHKEFVALEKEIIGSLDASNFWKLHLKNYTYKPLKPLTTSEVQVEAVAEEYNFGSEIIADLRELCRKLKVSPKAIFLSTYLDLIGTVMEENTVSVGVISNGRTERLSDPFGALGLFWNIVPFCQSITEEKAVQIKNVQQSLIDIEPYVRYPLLQILSDQQLKPSVGAELFFATFNFVHFHNAKNISDHTSLKVHQRRSHDKFNFPLNFAVSMESLSGNVSIRVEYDRMYFSCKDIRSMLQNYIEILKHTVHT